MFLPVMARQIALVKLRLSAARDPADPADGHVGVGPAVFLPENIAKAQGDPAVIRVQATALDQVVVVPAV